MKFELAAFTGAKSYGVPCAWVSRIVFTCIFMQQKFSDAIKVLTFLISEKKQYCSRYYTSSIFISFELVYLDNLIIMYAYHISNMCFIDNKYVIHKNKIK